MSNGETINQLMSLVERAEQKAAYQDHGDSNPLPRRLPISDELAERQELYRVDTEGMGK